jgi:hypothetical protein
MMNFLEHNLDEIENLSQRGKMLSIVDLINANTLDVDISAYCLYAISNGASFLTAARPGNAGKTTLMSCLLTFLPSDIRILTIDKPSVIAEAHKIVAEDSKLCTLCHEIGSGHVYGYLWGVHVGQLLDLMNYGCQMASCIHADTLPEMQDILVSNELGVPKADFTRLDLILFIKLMPEGAEYKRRVSALYERGIEKHNLLFTWDEETDSFIKHGESTLLKIMAQERGKSSNQVTDELQQCKSFIEDLVKSGVNDFRQVSKMLWHCKE